MTATESGPIRHQMGDRHRAALTVLADARRALFALGDHDGVRAALAAVDVAVAEVLRHGDLVRDGAVPIRFWLLVCPDCTATAGGRELKMPFGSAVERDRWWAAHAEGTGHDRARLWEEG